MSAISEEIKRLQLKIAELETELEKKDKEENNEKISIDYNFSVIDDLIKNKKRPVQTRTTDIKTIKTVQLCVIHLESIYNILQILDKRLKIIEEK